LIPKKVLSNVAHKQCYAPHLILLYHFVEILEHFESVAIMMLLSKTTGRKVTQIGHQDNNSKIGIWA